LSGGSGTSGVHVINNVEIIDSVVAHTRQLSKTLREADKLEAIRVGLDPDKAVFYSYRRGVYRKTALIGGRVAAMWGVSGTPLSLIGMPYLITGTEVQKIPSIRFAKIYIKEVQKMNRIFPVLQNYVDASYKGAVRLLQIAGFKLEGPIVLNNFEFYRFTMQLGNS
jgi:hypothetical protein